MAHDLSNYITNVQFIPLLTTPLPRPPRSPPVVQEDESPESMMLHAVSGEDDKDRSDRGIVTPWLKFMWETYRAVLDITRNNVKLDGLYQESAQRAFAFCLQYQRQTELKRLCDILRNHLTTPPKVSGGDDGIAVRRDG